MKQTDLFSSCPAARGNEAGRRNAMKAKAFMVTCELWRVKRKSKMIVMARIL